MDATVVSAPPGAHNGAMATLDDIREIVSDLPGTEEVVDGHRGGAAWRTKAGMFVWERSPGQRDLEQLAQSGDVWPDGVVVGVRTDGVEGAEALIAAFPELFFTIPHFDGDPAVLLRLLPIERDQLAEVVVDAWVLRAPKPVARDWLAERGLDA